VCNVLLLPTPGLSLSNGFFSSSTKTCVYAPLLLSESLLSKMQNTHRAIYHIPTIRTYAHAKNNLYPSVASSGGAAIWGRVPWRHGHMHPRVYFTIQENAMALFSLWSSHYTPLSSLIPPKNFLKTTLYLWPQILMTFLNVEPSISAERAKLTAILAC